MAHRPLCASAPSVTIDTVPVAAARS